MIRRLLAAPQLPKSFKSAEKVFPRRAWTFIVTGRHSL